MGEQYYIPADIQWENETYWQCFCGYLFHTVLAEVSEQEADWQSCHACTTCFIWQSFSDEHATYWQSFNGKICYILAELLWISCFILYWQRFLYMEEREADWQSYHVESKVMYGRAPVKNMQHSCRVFWTWTWSMLAVLRWKRQGMSSKSSLGRK